MQQTCALIVMIAAIAGPMSCGSTASGDTAGEAELAGSDEPFDDARGPRTQRAARPPEAREAGAREDRLDKAASTNVSSTATADDGSRYVAGVFSGSIVIGTFVLTSHGGDDVFVARLRPDGTVDWAHAVGSRHDERAPKVSFSDGRVKLVAMTDGAVDCGQGPLNTWSSETFFLCTFAQNGAPINGASFPTGRR
jgi:hypothetical protein